MCQRQRIDTRVSMQRAAVKSIDYLAVVSYTQRVKEECSSRDKYLFKDLTWSFALLNDVTGEISIWA